jgi:hypothetical protein
LELVTAGTYHPVTCVWLDLYASHFGFVFDRLSNFVVCNVHGTSTGRSVDIASSKIVSRISSERDATAVFAVRRSTRS